MMKSIKPAKVAANGITKRGKYTLVMSFSLAIKLLLDSVRA